MRRITITRNNGTEIVWRCVGASYGPDSRNLLLRNAVAPDGAKTLIVLLPLHNVLSVTEDEW